MDESALAEREAPRDRGEQPNDDPFAGYDPQRARTAFERIAGLLSGVDTETLKRDLLEQRSQDSAGRPA